MGVPAFYRWLSERYSRIVVYARDPDPNSADSLTSNPNDYEFDNLYLDLNCLIHPCCHPDSSEAFLLCEDFISNPQSEEDMFLNIFRYIDRIMGIIMPRKVLFIAIDGVAPRAKMNQQRSRRFRAAQEKAEAEVDETKLREEIMKLGRVPPARKQKDFAQTWDSNVITPGTIFMHKLSKRLKHFIIMRQQKHPHWQNIAVVFSDAQTPGEGEHKIMDFIRAQRSLEDYNPNTTHCLYGLDADLIMLGLATHEAHFTILREEVLFGKAKNQNGNLLNQQDAVFFDRNMDSNDTENSFEELNKIRKLKRFQFLRLWVLREYLRFEFRIEEFAKYTNYPMSNNCLKFGYDFERCIDDFVFLCFFVGNDFLPHLPSLNIREGGLELIFNLYKRFLPTLSGYLTKSGKIYLDRVEVILNALGSVENEIFRRRRNQELSMKRRREERNNQLQNPGPISDSGQPLRLVTLGEVHSKKVENLMAEYKFTEEEKARRKKQKVTEIDVKITADVMQSESAEVIFKEQLKAMQNERERFEVVASGENVNDEETESKVVYDVVRLGEEGWKDRYYVSKFGSEDGSDPEFRQNIVEEYVRGLCWVLSYYYNGCQSWRWFYPYHYAPFASDFINLEPLMKKIYSDKENENVPVFPPSKPFRPYEQLLSVLPTPSCHALPKPFQWFMTDPDSPIYDFYPADFKYDPNGKGVRWLWVALLPFVDEKQISVVMEMVEKDLSDKERARNEIKSPHLLVHSCSLSGKEIADLLKSGNVVANKTYKIHFGKVFLTELDLKEFNSGKTRPAINDFLTEIPDNLVLCVSYELDINSTMHRAIAGRLLKNVSFPADCLSPDDLKASVGYQTRGNFIGNLFDDLNRFQQSRASGSGGPYNGSGGYQSYPIGSQYEGNQQPRHIKYSNNFRSNDILAANYNHLATSNLKYSWGSNEPRQVKRSFRSLQENQNQNYYQNNVFTSSPERATRFSSQQNIHSSYVARYNVRPTQSSENVSTNYGHLQANYASSSVSSLQQEQNNGFANGYTYNNRFYGVSPNQQMTLPQSVPNVANSVPIDANKKYLSTNNVLSHIANQLNKNKKS